MWFAFYRTKDYVNSHVCVTHWQIYSVKCQKGNIRSLETTWSLPQLLNCIVEQQTKTRIYTNDRGYAAYNFISKIQAGMVVHGFSSNTWGTAAGESL